MPSARLEGTDAWTGGKGQSLPAGQEVNLEATSTQVRLFLRGKQRHLYQQ